MSKPILKTRTRFTSSLKNDLMEQFEKFSEETRITKSKLLDEAVEDLLRKHNRYKENREENNVAECPEKYSEKK